MKISFAVAFYPLCLMNQYCRHSLQNILFLPMYLVITRNVLVEIFLCSFSASSSNL